MTYNDRSNDITEWTTRKLKRELHALMATNDECCGSTSLQMEAEIVAELNRRGY